MLSRSCDPYQSASHAFHSRSMPCCMVGAPALSVVDAGVDLDLLLPQKVCSGDSTHLLQEEAVCIHDQDILCHLHINIKPDRSRHASLSFYPPQLLCGFQSMHSIGIFQHTPLAAGTGSTHACPRQRHQKCSGNIQGVKPSQGAGMSRASLVHTSCAFSSSLVRSTRLLLCSAVPASL